MSLEERISALRGDPSAFEICCTIIKSNGNEYLLWFAASALETFVAKKRVKDVSNPKFHDFLLKCLLERIHGDGDDLNMKYPTHVTDKLAKVLLVAKIKSSRESYQQFLMNCISLYDQ